MVDRCFISIDIDDPVIKRRLADIQNILQASEADIKNVESENIHITLRFLGEITSDRTESVSSLLKKISFSPFKLIFEGIGVFPNLNRPNVVWTGISGDMQELMKVFSELEKGLKNLGFEPERRGFQPHLTLCRVRSGRNRAQLAEAITLLGDSYIGEMVVEHIRLKKSVLTRDGPIYSTLSESTLV
ncbi:RNA 2',3'-cyclic phosphodiesterase [Candidatus Bathyarchaeota archaeon]|nr:RNA 2',3'-cyclic phosphodiesterase [Candidatus Bathyarchaeota archaeon]